MHRSPATNFLRQAEGFGDSTRLVLVGVEKAVDPELVSVAEQAKKLRRRASRPSRA